MTNAAAALAADPARFYRLDRIVAMGGAWRVPGNVVPEAEYNVWCDPESAQAVYDSGVPVVAVGLDVTRQVRVEANQVSKASDTSRLERVFARSAGGRCGFGSELRAH
jgi:inosine-uridine nucleoside N-ribohydrolase